MIEKEIMRTINKRNALAAIILTSALFIAGCAGGGGKPANQNQTAAPSQTATTAAAPPRTGYADVKGTRVHYQIYGDLGSGKTPLLILHGTFMSGDAMKPIINPFVAGRPVIAIDQRGHGRSGDFEGPLTYEDLADDGAAVLAALNVPTADVLGYSMGCTVAIGMAIRHPDRVGKLVAISGPYRRDGWYPEVTKAFEKFSYEMFAGSPLEAEYKRLSPTPDAFPELVEKVRVQDSQPQAFTEPQMRAIRGKTMIILGDADGVRLEHAVEMFKLRGGGRVETATKGYMTESPQARLAILPGTSHIGMMSQADLIASLVTVFLDDKAEQMPPGFF